MELLWHQIEEIEDYESFIGEIIAYSSSKMMITMDCRKILVVFDSKKIEAQFLKGFMKYTEDMIQVNIVKGERKPAQEPEEIKYSLPNGTIMRTITLDN